MLYRTSISIAALGLAVALSACVPPKAETVVEEPPKKKETKVEAPVVENPLPDFQDQGIRMPADMLGLPSDNEFRSAGSPRGSTNVGPVISRPPTEPPSRVRSTTPEGE